MKFTSLRTLLAVALLSVFATTAIAQADPAPAEAVEHSPSKEPGLDRDRAAYRAQMLEQKRMEEEERRKGAGLDRDRARQRAERMEERRE